MVRLAHESHYARKCSFCSKRVPVGSGTMYVKVDGTVYWFCSSKCRKNMLYFKRSPKKLKWARSEKKVKRVD